MNLTDSLSLDLLFPLPTAQRGTIDYSFLNNIQNSFGSWGLTTGTFYIILITAFAVCLAFGLGLLVNHFFIKKRDHTPPSWIVNRRDIIETLHLVMAQRSKVEMRFAGGDGITNRHSTACSLEEVHGDMMELEVSGFVNASQSWIERDVVGFFRVTNPSRPGHSDFFTFTSRIKGVRKASKDITYINVPVPDHIELSQKRLALRIEPPLQYSLGLAVWPEQLNPNGTPITKIKDWGRPPLLYSRKMDDLPLRIVNISAGGMRLEIMPEAQKNTGLSFALGERYAVMAQFYDPNEEKKLNLWTIVRIQNRFEAFDTHALEIGVQFVEEGRMVKDKGGHVRWRKVKPDGIDSIGNWVARRHLELYREKGLT